MSLAIANGDSSKGEDKPCACKLTAPLIQVARLWSAIPLTYSHTDQACIFSISHRWMAFSVVQILIILGLLIAYLDFGKLSRNRKVILIYLNDVIVLLYAILSVTIHVFSFIRTTKFVKFLNMLDKVVRELRPCRSVCEHVMKMHYTLTFAAVATVTLQYSTLVYLNYSEEYKTNFDYAFFVMRFIHDLDIFWWAILMCVMNLSIGLSACFEKTTASVLEFAQVHPLKAIVETNNVRDIMGLFKLVLHLISAQFNFP